MLGKTIAIVTAANAAISQVKQLARHGKDVASMGKQLSQIIEAEETLKAQHETKKKSLFAQAMGKSADTMEEFLELEKIKQAKAEIKSYFQLYGRPGLWNDWLKYEAQVLVRNKKEAIEREQARAFILNLVQWLIAVLFIFGTAFSLLYWAYVTYG